MTSYHLLRGDILVVFEHASLRTVLEILELLHCALSDFCLLAQLLLQLEVLLSQLIIFLFDLKVVLNFLGRVLVPDKLIVLSVKLLDHLFQPQLLLGVELESAYDFLHLELPLGNLVLQLFVLLDQFLQGLLLCFIIFNLLFNLFFLQSYQLSEVLILFLHAL